MENMTKTQLEELARDVYDMSYYLQKRLKSCKAWITTATIDEKTYTVLRSYNTIVALYSHETHTVYQFNWYSATTCQHVAKFVNEMSSRTYANKVTLYYHSRMNKKTFTECELNDFSNFIVDKAT